MSYTNGLDKPTDYFNTITYTGDNTDRSFTGVGFQPDWVWVKARNNTTWHMLFDSVRGAGVEKELHSNSTQAEGASDNVQYGYINSFDTDGFSTIDGTSPSDALNESGKTYVAWNWLAGGTASSNTDGSITSTVSANTTSGFSIVSYTGSGANATVGHGLGVAPQVIIWKKRSGILVWHFWHHSVPLSGGEYQAGGLNSTAAFAPFGTKNIMNGTAPTSTVFSLDTADYNDSGATYISYCFTEKKGYSKFTSFTGNGSSDGTFVYLGFRAAFLIIKRTDTSANWQAYDNKRDGYNGAGYPAKGNESLRPNSNVAESSATGYDIDILSNGIKLRNSSSTMNSSGASHIVMAFAESPFVTSTGIPCLGR